MAALYPSSSRKGKDDKQTIYIMLDDADTIGKADMCHCGVMLNDVDDMQHNETV